MEAHEGLSIDHVFLAVTRGGPEVRDLIDAGFIEGPPNVHPGQGTACRRMVFDGVYVEFLWAENWDELTTPMVSRTELAARLGNGAEASRIGICMRLPAATVEPIATWAYRPPYLPTGLSISMGANSENLQEPLIFFLPTALRRAVAGPRHPNGAGRVSRIRITSPALGRPSPELSWLLDSRLVDFEAGDSETLSVELDNGRRDQRVSLATTTPLTVSW